MVFSFDHGWSSGGRSTLPFNKHCRAFTGYKQCVFMDIQFVRINWNTGCTARHLNTSEADRQLTVSSTYLFIQLYVPLPTTLHLRWAVLAAEKKKHVLLEKPAALNVPELEKILEACESNGVQFMDATMWMHHPRTSEMRILLSDDQRFGQLKSVHSSFTYAADQDFLENNIRVKPELDALGALGDIGWYCIQAILWAADYELPKTVTALHEPELNESGVILTCGSSLQWKDGKVATFYCSFQTNLTMDLTVLGTRGSLHIHDFAVPFQENIASYYSSSQFKVPILMSEHSVMTRLPQEALMVREFADLVLRLKGDEGLEPEKKWPVITRKTQMVLDAVKASIEKGYEAVQVVD